MTYLEHETSWLNIEQDIRQLNEEPWLPLTEIWDLSNCLYYQKTDHIVIMGIHVNNFLSIVSIKEANDQFKEQLKERWVTLDSSIPRHIIGMVVEWNYAHKQVFLS